MIDRMTRSDQLREHPELQEGAAELRATAEALLAAPAFVVDRSKPSQRASGAVAAVHSLFLSTTGSTSQR